MINNCKQLFMYIHERDSSKPKFKNKMWNLKVWPQYLGEKIPNNAIKFI